MDVRVVLSSDEILRGLKHYKRIAKQDILRAEENGNSKHVREHAEARRQMYDQLAEVATLESPNDVVHVALEQYKKLPFVTGTPEEEYNDIKGKESALENFFSMINLEPKMRRETRKQRPSLKSLKQAV